MNRAATHPGLEHSGSIALPPSGDAASRIVANPVYKLLAGAIAGLVSLLVLVSLAYISLTISAIDSRLDKHDAANEEQSRDIKDLREWRIEHSAQIRPWTRYGEALEANQAHQEAALKQGEKMIEMLGQIADNLKR